MTSRERILKVLNYEIPDRVPISTYELVGYNSKAWENNQPSYKTLMDYIRKYTDCICMWQPGSNEMILGSAAKVDIKEERRELNDELIIKRKLNTPKGELTQTYKIKKNVNTHWQVEHWCKNIEDVEKILSLPYEPVEYDFSDYERIKNEVGDKGVIMISIPDPLCYAAELMDMGNFTVWAMTEPEHFEKVLKIVFERIMENLKRMLDIQIVDLYRLCGPEYATPPYLPPHLFNRFVTSYVKEMNDLIHKKGGKIRFHCHGRLKEVIKFILETDSDGLDPCEAPPDGDITLKELKQITKGKLPLFGNLQLKLLEHGTKEEVRHAVIDCIDAAKEDGGYVIMPTAAPINVPLSSKTEENYKVFIDTALEYGEY